jgi:hypothetical protein
LIFILICLKIIKNIKGDSKEILMRTKIKVFLLILFFGKIFATQYPTVGNDKYINFFNTSVLNGGDSVGDTSLGLCYFTNANGLRISDVTTDGTIVNIRTPIYVEKQIQLSEAVTLNLLSDLFLGGRIDLVSSGYIRTGADRICLNGPLYLGAYWMSATGNFSLRFFGLKNGIFFNDGGSIRQPNSSYELEFRSVVLNGVGQGSLIAAGNLILYDSIIKLDSDYCFNSLGSLIIYGDVLVTGTHTFCLDAALEIRDNSKLTFDVGTTFSMGLHGATTMPDNHTGSICFNGSNIIVSDSDFSVDYGRIIFENEVTIDDEGNYGEFVVGANTWVDVLATARVVLENTTTFSIL